MQWVWMDLKPNPYPFLNPCSSDISRKVGSSNCSDQVYFSDGESDGENFTSKTLLGLAINYSLTKSYLLKYSERRSRAIINNRSMSPSPGNYLGVPHTPKGVQSTIKSLRRPHRRNI